MDMSDVLGALLEIESGLATCSSGSLIAPPPCEHKPQPSFEVPVSPLLRLPGELRNRIYEYALTTDSTLHFMPATKVIPGESLKQVPRPRRRPFQKRTDVIQTTLVGPRKQKAKLVIGDAYYHSSSGQIPRTRQRQDPASVLSTIAIPRNEEESIAFDHAINPTGSSRDDQDFNKLKFVCRQLYRETAGLEAQFNTVQFTGRAPTPMFVNLLASCTPTRRLWFRNIILAPMWVKSDAFLPIELIIDLLPLAEYCRRNPSLTVKYMPKSFDTLILSPRDFMRTGCEISNAVRGKFPDGVVAVRGSNGKPADQEVVDALNVPNLRFWPWNVDEQFRLQVKKHSCPIQYWLEYAEEWLENGI